MKIINIYLNIIFRNIILIYPKKINFFSFFFENNFGNFFKIIWVILKLLFILFII